MTTAVSSSSSRPPIQHAPPPERTPPKPEPREARTEPSHASRGTKIDTKA